MKSNEAKDIVSTAVSTLAGELQKGHSKNLLRYLSVGAKFHKYSWAIRC